MFRARIFASINHSEAYSLGCNQVFNERPFVPRRNCLDRLFCRLLIDDVMPTPESDKQAVELLNNSLRLQQPAEEFSLCSKEPKIFNQALFVYMPDNETEDPKFPEEDQTVPSDESEESSEESSLFEDNFEQDVERLLWGDEE